MTTFVHSLKVELDIRARTMEFPEIKYIGIIFLWEYLQLTINIFIRRKKSQNWAEMSMTVMPAKFLCIIVVVWRVADKDSYIAQAAAQWFQVAKNPPKNKIIWRHFTSFFKELSADSHNFRFQLLHALHIKICQTNKTSQFHDFWIDFLAGFWHLAQLCAVQFV